MAILSLESLPPLLIQATAIDEAGAFVLPRPDAGLVLPTIASLALFAVASVGYALLDREVDRRFHAVMSLAFVLAVASRVHVLLQPVLQSSRVTSSVVLCTAFLLTVLPGLTEAWRTNLRSLRQAYDDQPRSHEMEMTRAALQERSRLAGTVVRVLRDGLAGSREATLVLAGGPDCSGSFDRILGQSLDRLAARLDLDIRYTAGGDTERLEPKVEAQLLTIVREALTNMARHADATVRRVRLTAGPDGLRVEVTDNGKGFDSATVAHGMGLRSMRQRAAEIGARLSIPLAAHGWDLRPATPFT